MLKVSVEYVWNSTLQRKSSPQKICCGSLGIKSTLPAFNTGKGTASSDRNLDDIVSALKLLDEANLVPTFAVRAIELGRIPSVCNLILIIIVSCNAA